VEGCCEHGNIPLGFIKCWVFLSMCITGGSSRRAQFHDVSWRVIPLFESC
jgi:hypothetical protein